MDGPLLRAPGPREAARLGEGRGGSRRLRQALGPLPADDLHLPPDQDNPERGLPWCRELSSLPSAHKAYLGWAFRNAGSPVQEECIGKILGLDEADRQKVLGARLHDPLARNPEHPGDLDMLWATFMATGAELPVERIIEVLGLPDPVQGAPDSVRILLLKGAARWSLSANIRQHRRVAEIAEARRTQASGQLRQALDEILAETRNPP